LAISSSRQTLSEPTRADSRLFWSTPVQRSNNASWYPFVKRLVDVFSSSLLLFVLSPLMFIVAVCIKLESRGPIFFCQERCGIYGKQFLFFKFRSMVSNAEEQKLGIVEQSDQGGIRFKMATDPRVTSMGKFIRKYSIDELPQLLNVLLGDMSLVGPRPPLPKEVECYDHYQKSRLAVVPGITCTWQIGGRSEIPFEEQVEMDIAYIEARSIMKDLMILIKTPVAVIGAKGAY
jgi:lipopolysaccharide/colanic/teichoic acid biosynthesis glycosyltransferase